MGKTRKPFIHLLFVLVALTLIYLFAKIPDQVKWNIVLFLGIMVVFDRINIKVFSHFGYSFSTVILGLIIFDHFSIVYGLIYIMFDFMYLLITRARGFLLDHIAYMSINLIAVTICNEFYNGFTSKDYLSRYGTLLILLLLTVILRYIYFYLQTGKATSKYFIDSFGPMVFEIFIIFPVLSFFGKIDTNFILILYLTYYTSIGFLHRKFMGVNLEQFNIIVKGLEERYNFRVYFTDLGEIKGACYPKRNSIFIDEKMDYPEQLQTLIHESLHFRLRTQYNVSVKLEECIVTLLEAIISWYYIIKMKEELE